MKKFGKIMLKVAGVIFGVLLILFIVLYIFSSEIMVYVQKKQCENENYQACAEVGNYYDTKTSQGLPGEYHLLMKKARHYRKKACKGGIAYSCFSYGFMLEHGQGGEQDEENAVVFYEKACDGDSTIGCMYASLLLFGREKFERAIVYAIKRCTLLKNSCYLTGSFYLRSGKIAKAEKYISDEVEAGQKREYLLYVKWLLFNGREEALDMYRDFFDNKEVRKEGVRNNVMRLKEIADPNPEQSEIIEKTIAEIKSDTDREIRKTEILNEVVRLKEIVEHYPEQEEIVERAIEMLNSLAARRDYEEDIIYARSWCDEMNHPFFCIQLGWFLILEKRLPEADSVLKKAKIMIPESYSPHIRAHWHLVQGEKEKAISLYEAFLDQYKNGKNPARLKRPADIQIRIEFEFSRLEEAYPEKKEMLDTMCEKLMKRI